MPTTVGTVMLLCLLPVGTMVVGSIIVTFFQPGPKLTSAMQHFAAGIVLAAVAIELAPQLAIRIHGQNGVFTIAMLLGFFFAVGVLMLISRYFDADDDDEDEGKKTDELKKKEPETNFTSNPVAGIGMVSSPTASINLDIGSNRPTSTAYNSPTNSPPRSPMGPTSLDVNSVNVSMPGSAPGEADPNARWQQMQQQQPGYGNNNNWNNNNNNNWNNNNNRNRDDSFPTQIDHIQYGARGTMDSGYGGRGTMDAGYGGRNTIGEGSEVSASSYSNNSQTPLTRAPNSSVSTMGNNMNKPPRYGGNQGGGYGNNGNNFNQNMRNGPYPPPPGPPSMPSPEGDWNGNNNGNWGNNNNGGYGGNNNWNNGYNNERGQNMYNANNGFNTRTRQRGQSQHTWQPRVRYAAQWKNQGRSDMGYVPPPPPRRNGGGGYGNNQWGNSMRGGNNNNNWNNTNRTMDQTHARMPSYMLHGTATTGLAKSIARNSFKATPPTNGTLAPMSFINTDLKKPGTVAVPDDKFVIPWGLIVAVAVDASTDGILIGIASAVGQGGIIIAIALSIEMSFLGISTSVEMSEANVPKNLQIPLLMILPGFILVGGAIGATVMAGVQGALFVAFLAFGAAALLFLVTEELLISAHEDLAHDTWYVSISFFFGFMVVLIMDQFSGPNMCIDSINMAFAGFNLDEFGQQFPNTKVLTNPQAGIP